MKKNDSNTKAIKYGPKDARKHLPTRSFKDNKTRGGKSLVIAGSRGMFGSAILTCLAAARSGAGYTYLISDGKFPIAKHPDFLVLAGNPKFSNFQAVAIGPGFKNHKKIIFYLKTLKQQKIKNVVLDAEALNAISKTQLKLSSTWIVTPHEGELSRILKVPSKTIRDNRKKYVLIAQKKLGCIVLLKGHKTLVCDGKNLYEIQSGNPALAKAGTGDVLTGMVLAFLSQGMDSTASATFASYIHGSIADNWIKSENDVLSFMASDIVDLIPKAFNKIRRKNSKILF